MSRRDVEVQSAERDAVAAPNAATPLSVIVRRRMSRRATVMGLLAAGATTALGAGFLGRGAFAGARGISTLTFRQVDHVIKEGHEVAPGYSADVLIRWGDKVLKDAPAFDVTRLTAEAQAKQFGYNCDFVGYLPLPRGSDDSEHGLLCVNHEYTNAELMWPGLDEKTAPDKLTKEQVAVEMAAHGHAVVEIRKQGGKWRVVDGSAYARRVTAETEMLISGPAAGHPRLGTKADPVGRRVKGTLNNCAGGTTPWGTVLIAEENFDGYFGGDPAATPEARNLKRLGFKAKSRYAWSRFHDRFDVTKEPNEPNRFGWMVELDPYDPISTPVKRTALGRFKHEGATTAVMADGRVVVYSGDDQAFDYLYRFVTAGRFVPGNPAANRDLLDSGALSVAKFEDDGKLRWLPLKFGEGPLTPANGFASQADVLIETRRAADLLGATPMDRPEDVEPNPVSGRVYLLCTNNASRKAKQADAANPRGPSPYGHIIEMLPPGTEGPGMTAKAARHDADVFAWNILLLAGDPRKPEHGAKYHPDVMDGGAWLAAPDNCAFDRKGRLWIATDQGSAQRKNGIPDGMYACDLEGPGRALTRFFYACPRDAEMCGPAFTPDGKTLFVAVQHPGESSDSLFERPSTRWPDFRGDMPPRPSVVTITKDDGGEIGG